MKKLFNAWLTKYGVNVTVLGRQFQFARPGVKDSIAKKLEEESPLSICLSTLYKHQGWLQDMRDRSLAKNQCSSSAVLDYNCAAPVPLPRRHGGYGRGAAGQELNEDEIAFGRGALGIFEFGGDVEATPAGNGPSKTAAERIEADEMVLEDNKLRAAIDAQLETFEGRVALGRMAAEHLKDLMRGNAPMKDDAGAKNVIYILEGLNRPMKVG